MKRRGDIRRIFGARIQTIVGLIICAWLVIASFSFIPPSAKEQIRWMNSTQLSADDFRKKNPGRKVKVKTGRRTYRMLEGYIHSGIAFSYVAQGSKVEYEVYAFMLPDESWLADRNNLGTLEHEQAHFNISEMCARALREKLSHIDEPAVAKLEYQRMMRELARTQAGFDQDHDDETGVTEKWQKKIDESLNKKAAFAATIVIPIKKH